MSNVGSWRPGASGNGPGQRKRRRFQLGSSDPVLESPQVRNRLTSRVRVAEGLVTLLVVLLLFGFWRLQVVHAAHYRELSENNRLRNLVVRAPYEESAQ